MEELRDKKLHWKVKHTTDFSKECDFLEELLIENGVNQQDIQDFLHPTTKFINDPFLFKNMEKAVVLFHDIIKSDKTKHIFVKPDTDVDGFSSASVMIQFIKELNPNIEVEWKLNYEKKHGLFFSDLSDRTKDYFDLIIIPDASMICKEAIQIKNNFKAPIIVLDHHLVENEYYNKKSKQWISREEAKILYREDKDLLKVDCYTNYCLAVNSTDGQYPNPTLCGAGVVQKFIEAYLNKYENTESISANLRDKYYDLVSLALIADSMDVRNLETRFYVLEGLKEYYYNNEFLNELEKANEEDMKFGRTIISMGWTIAPKINGCIRYGKDKEQNDTFRAILGEQENIEYQPRRKKASDPKPPVEIHSLQKTMARVVGNIKSRQDTEVRKFVQKIQDKIEQEGLDQNSIIFVDGTDILTKSSITGLIANKLTSKYFRPVVIMKSKDATEYGGSCRNYGQGNIDNLKEFLESTGLITVAGHADAAGIFLKKENLQQLIEKCNQKMPLDQLCTIHTVDWEIAANKLKQQYVKEVAENYKVFGNTVPEPLFAITNLKINASQISAYGENNGFIRFVYNNIVFIKKYCPNGDYDNMTLRTRNILGANKKNLKLNLICQFILNSFDDKINPEVKILYYDVEEDLEAPKVASVQIKSIRNSVSDFDDDDWDSVPKKQIKKIDLNDDDFDW